MENGEVEPDNRGIGRVPVTKQNTANGRPSGKDRVLKIDRNALSFGIQSSAERWEGVVIVVVMLKKNVPARIACWLLHGRKPQNRTTPRIHIISLATPRP